MPPAFNTGIDSIGASGSSMVDITTRGGRKVIFFVHSNRHFIFILLFEGNMVSAVVYVSRM